MKKIDNKYQIVTGIHGNERLPILAMASRRVNQLVANSMAVARNVRFVEKDMNASFGTNGNSYEEIRAREVLNILDLNRLVVDFHTTLGVSEPFVIVVDKKMINFAKTLGIERVVYMKYNNKGGHALINFIDGVSVECGLHEDSKSFENAIGVLESLTNPRNTKCKIYEVYASIEKPGNYTNFKPHKDGFIPVFAMKNSYNNYGLKARLVEDMNL